MASIAAALHVTTAEPGGYHTGVARQCDLQSLL